MSTSKDILKTYFQTGDFPTEAQFAELIDSFLDIKQPQGNSNRRFVIDSQGSIHLEDGIVIPEYTLSNTEKNKLSLLKDENVVSEILLNSSSNNTILKKEVIFEINNLNVNDTYEVLSQVGVDKLPIIHNLVFDIEVVKPYLDFATDVLFKLETSRGTRLSSSSFIDIQKTGRSIFIKRLNTITFSSEDFNQSIKLKPCFNTTNGSLKAKVILFYSLLSV